jgi:hypothetical protein
MIATTFRPSGMRTLGTFLVGTIAVAGCGVDKQTAPSFIGPSGHALEVVVTATPDTLVQDGASQATVMVVAKGPDGQPVPGLQFVFSAVPNSALVRSASFTAPSVATNDAGVAITQLIAPLPPATQAPFLSEPVLTVYATPVGSNFANQSPRAAQVRLLAPDGTPLGNSGPTAVIVAEPRVVQAGQSVHLDASLTTDEGGLACGTRCQYTWSFTDGSDNARGVSLDHVFESPGLYTVTLLVTDGSGGVHSTTIDITVLAS